EVAAPAYEMPEPRKSRLYRSCAPFTRKSMNEAALLEKSTRRHGVVMLAIPKIQLAFRNRTESAVIGAMMVALPVHCPFTTTLPALTASRKKTSRFDF